MLDTDTLHSLLNRDLANCRVIAAKDDLDKAREVLPVRLTDQGLGEEAATQLLLDTIAPALAAGQAGPRYYGFVTGGVTPVALAADVVASSYDSNVQVHLPNDTISTHVESLALDLVLDLLDIPVATFGGRTVTTGATASNVIGLALGREFAVGRVKGQDWSVAEDGLGGVDIDVLCAGAHASIKKAAAINGIGRSRVLDLTDESTHDEPVAFDMAKLDQHLKAAKERGRGVIVCPSYGEVNTGAFTPNMTEIRRLCDEYGAWVHLDAAFGGFGALHEDFAAEVREGMMLADSLTLDGHKWLNVPYDCGLFYTRSSKLHQTVFGPGASAPAYLSTGVTDIPSPLNVGIENSRRFRALPLYCSLIAYGKEGYQDIIRRNIAYARAVERWLRTDASLYYDVLTPPSTTGGQDGKFKILNIVLFAPKRSCGKANLQGEDAGSQLVKTVNESGEMYLTATRWQGRSAARLAVSNHLTGLNDRDLEIVKKRLMEVMQ